MSAEWLSRGSASACRTSSYALALLLGGNLGEIAFTLGTGLLSGEDALNARQLLLVNLLTDAVPAMALAVRPPRGSTPEALLSEGPESALGAALTHDMYIRGGVTAGAAATAWLLTRMLGGRGRASTTGLVALVGAQLAQTIAARGRTRLVVVSGLASFAVLGLIVQTPRVSQFFGCRPLWPQDWAAALACSLLATVLSTAAQRTPRAPGSAPA